jgi:predicted short-subunit dehydrogenase-like oxidoreductase (DUF2520 family)
MRVGIIGGGRAAWAFGTSLARAGWEISGVALRTSSQSSLPEKLKAKRLSVSDLAASSDVLFAGVSDSALEELAAEIDSAPHGPKWRFHPSGSRPGLILGDRAFALHPLRSLPPFGTGISLAGTLFTFDGPDEAEPLAREIVEALGGRFNRIAADRKILYHCAAVFAANYTAAVCEVAAELFARAGLEGEIEDDVRLLAESALHNWSLARVRGFTGPLVRGDAEVMAGHLQAIEGDRDVRRLYIAAARTMLRQLVNGTGDHENFQRIARLIDGLDVP